MKRILTLVAALVLLASVPTFAQAPTLTQQAPQQLNACTPINGTATINTAVTVTLTPPAGQYVYICGLDVSSSQNGTATANTNSQYTSTNLGGWSWKYSLAATANTMASQGFFFSQAVKSAAPGTAVTIVSPAGLAQTMFSINVYYYYGN